MASTRRAAMLHKRGRYSRAVGRGTACARSSARRERWGEDLNLERLSPGADEPARPARLAQWAGAAVQALCSACSCTSLPRTGAARDGRLSRRTAERLCTCRSRSARALILKPALQPAHNDPRPASDRLAAQPQHSTPTRSAQALLPRPPPPPPPPFAPLSRRACRARRRRASDRPSSARAVRPHHRRRSRAGAGPLEGTGPFARVVAEQQQRPVGGANGRSRLADAVERKRRRAPGAAGACAGRASEEGS